MDLNMKGDVAIITGGGAGIGAEMARSFAVEGCRVAIWDINHDKAEAVAAEIVTTGSECIAVKVDITQRPSVEAAMNETLARYGSVEILVNNAGFSQDRPFLEMTDDDWNIMIGVCLTGTFLCTQAALATMAKNGYGRIVNITSRAHLGGEPNTANYSAAKGGVVSLTKALSFEFGKRGITVNAVAPGFTLTERTRMLGHFAEIEQRAINAIPVARLGSEYDTARAALFLSSRDAGYISGLVLYVTGGRY